MFASIFLVFKSFHYLKHRFNTRLSCKLSTEFWHTVTVFFWNNSSMLCVVERELSADCQPRVGGRRLDQASLASDAAYSPYWPGSPAGVVFVINGLDCPSKHSLKFQILFHMPTLLFLRSLIWFYFLLLIAGRKPGRSAEANVWGLEGGHLSPQLNLRWPLQLSSTRTDWQGRYTYRTYFF